MTSLSTAVAAREPLIDTWHDGASIIVFEDGFWRYDDSAGPRCTEIKFVGSFCGLPSVWARFPQPDASALRPLFERDGFEGFVTSLTPVTRPVESKIVSRVISDLSGFKSPPTLLVRRNFESDGMAGQRLVYAGTGTVVAYSLLDQNGRIIVVQTKATGFSVFHRDHEAAHEALLSGLVLDPFDGLGE